MRVSSLIILIAVVGGLAYLFVFQRDWIFRKGQEASELAAGYTAAQTPAEAMEQFRKAIQERKYSTAAKYCSGDYAQQLAKAHDAAAALAGLIDSLHSWMDGRSYKTDRAVTALFFLDPFPKNFKIKDVPKKDGEDRAFSHFEVEPISGVQGNLGNDTGQLDPNMFRNCLVNPIMFSPGKLELVREGDSSWKLKIPLYTGQAQLIAHLKDNYKRYETDLSRFLSEVTNQRFESRDAFAKELVQVLIKAK